MKCDKCGESDYELETWYKYKLPVLVCPNCSQHHFFRKSIWNCKYAIQHPGEGLEKYKGQLFLEINRLK